MASSFFVRARIDEDLKEKAAAVLAEFGLTVSDIVRMTLTRVAKDRAVPPEFKIPNAKTGRHRRVAASHENQGCQGINLKSIEAG
jgi:addiction module RelB/DinJ family antitoxin